MHKFILDNIEIILAIIIVAQGIILYGQSCIKDWCDKAFTSILNFMNSSNTIYKTHREQLEEIRKKLGL